MFLHINKITKSKCLGQGNHARCHQDSRCKEDGYVCSKKPLVSERAIAAYWKAVEGTTVFKNAEDYVLVIFNYSNGEMFQCNFKICPKACQEIFIDYDKPAIPKKRIKNTPKYLLWWKYHGDGVMVEWGTTVGKGWEVIFSWIVNKTHSCLMLLRHLFLFDLVSCYILD